MTTWFTYQALAETAPIQIPALFTELTGDALALAKFAGVRMPVWSRSCLTRTSTPCLRFSVWAGSTERMYVLRSTRGALCRVAHWLGGSPSPHLTIASAWAASFFLRCLIGTDLPTARLWACMGTTSRHTRIDHGAACLPVEGICCVVQGPGLTVHEARGASKDSDEAG